MEGKTLEDWLDRHHVDVVRTFATTLDGAGVGKYVHRRKFIKTLPAGHPVADMAGSQDLAGVPHMTFWHDDRLGGLGDIHMRPDLSTLISDGTDPNLGHCMCDFFNADGTPFALCSRSKLRTMVDALAARGLTARVAFELEFYLYNDSFEALKRKHYANPDLVTSSRHHTIYMLRNAYPATRYMGEVISRLEWKGIEWEGWNDEAGVGQFELNLEPGSPLTAADTVMRTRQIMHEVARDLDMAVTFMAAPGDSMGSGLHVHLSLIDEDGNPVFHDPATAGGRSMLMNRWVGGLMETMPAAVSFLCPSINSFRRMRDYTAVPMTPQWGEDNKTTALRTIAGTPGSTRIEHRLAAADANPYLALATLIAGGLAGMDHELEPPDSFDRVAWGLPGRFGRLPNTISRACEALDADAYLHEQLGPDFVDYWGKTRHQEWLLFHTEGGDPEAKSVSPWEFDRYFEII